MDKLKEIKKISWLVLALAVLFGGIFFYWLNLIFQGKIMPPATFNLLGLTGHYYGLVIFIALVCGYLVARKLAALKEINLDKYLPNVFVGFFVALLFARLGYVIFQIQNLKNFWEIFAAWQGGLSIHGALFGIFLYLFYLSRRYQIALAKFIDILSPGIILGQAIGRWGNFLNGEAYGPPTNLPWKLFIDPSRRLVEFAEKNFYHPAFLYESLGDLVIFFILLYVFALNKKSGTVGIFYLLLYSILRFAIEFFRIDSVQWGFLSVAQWASLVFIGISIYLLFLFKKNQKAK